MKSLILLASLALTSAAFAKEAFLLQQPFGKRTLDFVIIKDGNNCKLISDGMFGYEIYHSTCSFDKKILRLVETHATFCDEEVDQQQQIQVNGNVTVYQSIGKNKFIEIIDGEEGAELEEVDLSSIPKKMLDDSVVTIKPIPLKQAERMAKRAKCKI